MTAQEQDYLGRGPMANAAADERDRDPDEIEHEIERTRAQMSDTLDAIQRKFSPNHLSEQALGYLRSNSGRQFLENLTATVRENPIPVTLIGIGLIWLAASQFRRSAAGSTASAHGSMRNEGEGSYTAARRYREATEGFVDSGRVEPSARAARASLDTSEGTALQQAERIGKAHAKGEDPLLHKQVGERVDNKPPTPGVERLDPRTAPPITGADVELPHRERERQPFASPTGETT